jgi:hypothetical protein
MHRSGFCGRLPRGSAGPHLMGRAPRRLRELGTPSSRSLHVLEDVWRNSVSAPDALNPSRA